MANPEHLAILKQGVEVWNKWRTDNFSLRPDLSEIDLGGKFLYGVNFSFTNLHKSKFLVTNLMTADVSKANLEGAALDCAQLKDTNFNSSNLSSATFSGAALWRATLSNADLSNAIFTDAALSSTLFLNSNLTHTDFNESILDGCVFANCDLSKADGLEYAIQNGPSTIGIDTINKSKGRIPEIFLQKCGLSDTFITYAKSLVNNPIEYYSCFISFTEKDDLFSERLYNDMQAKGVRCWRWKEDAKWGRTLRKEIDEAIRYHEKLVVICSKDSLNAPAVLEEIERALDKEDMLKRKGEESEVLFPIRIDDFIFDGWESELKIRLTRKNIGDFCHWNSDAEKYRKSVERLVRDLNRPRSEKS